MKDEKKDGRYLGLPSLLGSITGAGTAYLAAQAGTIGYITIREMMNLALGQPLSSVPEILREYVTYTSLAGAIGEISGSLLAKRIWNALKGR
jgi:hypothetical protein